MNMKFGILVLISASILSTTSLASSNASLLSLKFDGVYGGVGRHMSKIDRYTLDLTSGSFGAFIGKNIKIGFSSKTLTGILSDRKDDDLWDSVGRTNDNLGYRKPMALPIADFTYTTLAMTAEFVGDTGTFLSWSVYTDLGMASISRNKVEVATDPDSDIYDINQLDVPIVEFGAKLVFKLLPNLQTSVGYGYRKDIGNKSGRPTDFGNLNSTTFTYMFYMVM